MKRILIVLPLLAGLAMPASAAATGFSSSVCAFTELPWSTVQAVLKKVAALGDRSYQALVNGYDEGTVTVTQSGSGYRVTVGDADGIVEIIVIDEI